MKKPLLLMILDGFGIAGTSGNAIYAANKPNLSKIFSNNPITQIGASGIDVGLPNGQMGNSEVGHTNIGAGRIVYQELTRITKAIDDKSFFENKVLNKALDNVIANNSSLHLMGLLSDGGVHSYNHHLYALLRLAKKRNIKNVYIHAFLDGRDTAPMSGKNFIKECQDEIEKIGVGTISSISGRYYAMDRDNRWERIQQAYDCINSGQGEYFKSPIEAIENSYKKGITDEFIIPCVCSKKGHVQANDSIIFFNFRPDRARELTRVFVDKNFDKFSRKTFVPVEFVCMTQYDATMPNVEVAFTPERLSNTFAEYISKKGLTQLRIAETEKYAHVTFFFNGGVETKYVGEDRILVNSPQVSTYDLQPEMSAFEVTNKVIDAINSNKYDVIILNFANCDMVGHSGIFDATVKAVEAIDLCVGKIIDTINKIGGIAIITSDHGNADKMFDENQKPFTAHTTNPVPFCIVGYKCKLKPTGKLADIAPTMLNILGLDKPIEMSGHSLIVKE